MMEYLISALHNVGRKKLRSLLTIVGIAIGVASVIIISAVGEGGKTAISGELDSLGINGLNVHLQSDNSGNTGQTLMQDDVTACISVPGVQAAMPIIMQTGISVNRGITKSILAWGIGSNAGSIISLKMSHGKLFSAADIQNHSKVCVVDEQYAKSFYSRSNITGKTITVYLGNDFQQLKVVGMVEQGSSLLYNLVGNYMPSFVYMPYTTAEDLKGKNGYNEISVKVDQQNSLDTAGTKIENLLNRIHGTSDEYVVDNMLKQKQRLSNMLNIVTLIISAIGGISLIVAGLSIMTVMTVSVNERTKEIGIKKAIGAKSAHILAEFLLEALVISLLGCAAGIAAGLGIAKIASLVMHLTFAVNAVTLLYTVAVSIGIGVLFGVYPAVVASRLNPVDALRQE